MLDPMATFFVPRFVPSPKNHPSRGPVIEVGVLWYGRVLMVKHFKGHGAIHVGSSFKNHIVIPQIGFVGQTRPMILVEYGQAIVCGSPLSQDQECYIDLGEGVSLRISYASKLDAPRMAPLIDISEKQATALVTGLMSTLLFFWYALVMTPLQNSMSHDEEKIHATAKFFYPSQREISSPIPPPMAQHEQAAPKSSSGPVQISNKSFNNGPHSRPQNLLSVLSTHGIMNQIRQAHLVATLTESLGQQGQGKGGTYDDDSETGALRGTGFTGAQTQTVGVSVNSKKGALAGHSGTGFGLGKKQPANIAVEEEGFKMTGAMDREAIRRVVLANLRQIRECYEEGLNREPGLYGKIVAQWTIGPQGQVLETGISQSTMGSSLVENCLTRRLKQWIFPKPPSGEVAVVSYPFLFQAQ